MVEENQEGQKTVVSFIVGLLIGGLLVWAFSGPAVDAPSSDNDAKVEQSDDKLDDKNDSKDDEDDDVKGVKEVKEVVSTKDDVVIERVLPVGDGNVAVSDQAAGKNIALANATYPIKEGWIGVRDYQGGQLAGLLGVVRFSEEQGLVPSEIILQRATVAGKEYAVVIYTESGDRKFSLADDVQVDSIFATFKAK
jgi:hypothetical protein